MRPIESLLPTTLQRAPVPCLFPGPAHPALRRSWLRWVAAHRAGDESVSRRSASLRRIAQEWWGRCLPPTRLRDRTSDTPVATLASIPVRACFAVRVVFSPIRREPPRPLPPHRRDTAKLFPARGAFDRQVMHCSCSDLSAGDCAPFVPRFPPADRSVGFSWGPPARWLQPTPVRVSRLFVAAGSPRHAWSTHREASYVARAII